MTVVPSPRMPVQTPLARTDSSIVRCGRCGGTQVVDLSQSVLTQVRPFVDERALVDAVVIFLAVQELERLHDGGVVRSRRAHFISRRRFAERASNRLATLKHAIRRSTPTAA